MLRREVVGGGRVGIRRTKLLVKLSCYFEVSYDMI